MAVVQGEFWTEQFSKTSGLPYSGVLLYHYAAGTSTPKTVYVDAAMTTPAAQPVVGDTRGRVSFYGDGDYRLVVRSSVVDGSLDLYDWDNVKLTAKAATLRGENQGTVYPPATSANRGQLFAKTDALGNLVEVAIQKDTAFSALFLLGAALSSIVQFGKGADLSSAGTLTLGSDGNAWDVIGTVGIQGLTAKPAGTVIWLRFTGVLTLTYNATSLKLIGNQDYTTSVNDLLAFLSLGNGNWEEVSRNGVLPVGAGGTGIITATQNGVLLGGGTNSPIVVTAAGAASRLFGIGSGGGAPSFIQLTNGMIPSGLITQAHIAKPSIGTPELKTATTAASVQGSTYNVTQFLSVTMNDYSFFPSFTAERLPGGSTPFRDATANWDAYPNLSDPNNTLGRFRMYVRGPAPGYDGGIYRALARWRYMTASDNPHVWIIADQDTGHIVAAWWSDDPLPEGAAPIAMKGRTARRVTAGEFEQLSIPPRAIAAAEERMAVEQLKPDHLVYRAIQAHADDPAPVRWLMDEMRVRDGRVSPMTPEEKAARLPKIMPVERM